MPRHPLPARRNRRTDRLVHVHCLMVAAITVASTFGGAHLSGCADPPMAWFAQDATLGATDDTGDLDLAAATLDATDLAHGARLISDR